MKNSNKITRAEYMNNSAELHHAYFSQFITDSTNKFILSSLSIENIKKALANGDEHLNKIPFNNMGNRGSWWWDHAPINISLLKELGENNSHSTHTCVAKAAAKILSEKI